jgi:LL-diaminopimelate aminotransferase
LREQISSILYRKSLSPDEVFISDGAKGDIGRLQMVFGPNAMCVCLDPTYPAYADTARLIRPSHRSLFSYVSCSSLESLSLSTVPDGAIVFLCSPNNPTGEVFSFSKFRSLVLEAKRRHLILVLDTTYRAFIQEDLPRSIYEIEGAKEVAIEIGSFSKMAGFSGIRLGWTVIPQELTSEDGFSLHHDYQRLMSTIFNGASILSQKGGLQALSPTGQKECERQINVYRNNTLLLQKTFVKKDFPVWGGKHAPYIWVKIRHRSSWEAFEYFLQKAGVIVTPGIGFGPSGEGYIRICGFGNPSTIEEAVTRISML